jgi:hypothetical protein
VETIDKVIAFVQRYPEPTILIMIVAVAVAVAWCEKFTRETPRP